MRDLPTLPRPVPYLPSVVRHHPKLAVVHPRPRSQIVTISLTLPTHNDLGPAQPILKECRSTLRPSSVVSALKDLREPTTSDHISALILTNGRSSAPYVGRHSRDSTTENGTKVYTRERRNSYAKANSKAVITGAVGDGSQGQTHSEDISAAKLGGYASNRCSTKKQ